VFVPARPAAKEDPALARTEAADSLPSMSSS
jgi:hypothetical protein